MATKSTKTSTKTDAAASKDNGIQGAEPSEELIVGESTGAGRLSPEREAVAGGNVDQIRDILFGSQMKDYERRFQRLEEGLKKELADLRLDLKSQFDNLEQHHRSEFKDVRDAQTRETKDRLEAVQELSESIKENAELNYQRIKELEADLDRRAAELRDQILNQSRKLAEDIQQRDDRLSNELSQTESMLDDRKLDRSALAQLLVEVAMRISDAPGDDIS